MTQSGTDLDALVAAFRASTLPKSQWTHLAHLRVGAWHVARHGPSDALGLLRQGIRALNERHGVANTDSSGYHETVTRAYVALLAAFLDERSNLSLPAAVEELVSSALARKDLLLDFYSSDRLMSTRARSEWVEPDVRPLPGRGASVTGPSC
jgi:hypothetical protein